jgi:transposase
MAKRQFRLTDTQVQELIVAFDGCKDGPTRTRYQALRLYGTGYPTKEVMNITGCTRSSLMNWCRTYRLCGIKGLVDKRQGGNRARLNQMQIAELGDRLRMYTPADLFGMTAATKDGQFWTVPDLQRAVEQWYGVSYRHSGSYHRLFDLTGFSYQRPAKVYKSRSAVKAADFEERLEKNSSM